MEAGWEGISRGHRLLEVGGGGTSGTLFTPFCFSVASTFAKTGLLTFRGKRGLCVARSLAGRGGSQEAAGVGVGVGPGPRGGSEHRAHLWVGLRPWPSEGWPPSSCLGGQGCRARHTNSSAPAAS